MVGERVQRVSVLVPLHNAEPYIAQTLNSILQETEVPIEVVVVNDRSTDHSLDVVKRIRDERIRVVEGPGRGIAACLNAGLAAVRGEVLMRCDADDLYPVGRIREQLAWLDAHSEYGAVCGSFSTMDESGRVVADLVTGDIGEEITEELNNSRTRTHLCSYAIRMDVLRGLDGFRSFFVTAEDIDFQLRLGEVARVMYLPRTFYLYRLHDASITHTQGNAKRLFFENTARLFQEQRKTDGQDDLQRGCPPAPPEGGVEAAGSVGSQIGGYLTGLAWREHAAGNKFKALGLGFRAVQRSPWDMRSWRSLFALLLKPAK